MRAKYHPKKDKAHDEELLPPILFTNRDIWVYCDSQIEQINYRFILSLPPYPFHLVPACHL